MHDLVHLLEKIQGGKKSFQPSGNSTEAYKDFDNLVRALEELESRELISGLKVRRNHTQANRYYLEAVVRDGITRPGEEFLLSNGKKHWPIKFASTLFFLLEVSLFIGAIYFTVRWVNGATHAEAWAGLFSIVLLLLEYIRRYHAKAI